MDIFWQYHKREGPFNALPSLGVVLEGKRAALQATMLEDEPERRRLYGLFPQVFLQHCASAFNEFQRR